VTDNCKATLAYFFYRINYGHKKFYDNGLLAFYAWLFYFDGRKSFIAQASEEKALFLSQSF
jgi:hypothetical protein